MLPVTNISSYKFTPLTGLRPLRDRLAEQCKKWGLKGTILLSHEGINLFVAGPRDKIDALVSALRKIPGLEDLTPKISESEDQPFTRMLVKVKREIIAFGVEGINPALATSPKLKPTELKAWLDAGKDVLLLDTRNDYEVKLGTFKNALPIGINHFRDFPAAVQKLPSELKEKPVVMFCTGGIRCEKAGPFMEREGFRNVFQLDGGILKYFEECGDSHYSGSCFVFDQRVGVDPGLHESNDKQCFLCLAPLTPEDQKDPRYQIGVTCPYCYKSPEAKMAETLVARKIRVQEVCNPLPGKAPYDNERPLKVPEKYDGATLIHFISSILPHTERSFWETEISAGRVVNNSHEPRRCSDIVKSGERYLHLLPATSEPDVNVDIDFLFEDEAILVINKPAPLPVHPSGRFNRNTLQYILNQVYSPSIPRLAHRLDANTTGVIVFSRSKHFAGLLQPQFEQGLVEKFYLAKVHGHPKEDFFSCNLNVGKEPTELGARLTNNEGREALTQFRVLRRNSDGTSLLEAKPITGRTNQIRVHLWKLGYPIFGDQVYIAGQQIGNRQTHPPVDPPLCLHAHQISFLHPISRKRMRFSSLPEWFATSRP